MNQSPQNPLTPQQIDTLLSEIALTSVSINWLANHLDEMHADSEAVSVLTSTIGMLAQRVGWMADLRIVRGADGRFPVCGGAEDWMVPALFDRPASEAT